jgi:hypothetical protein
MTTYVYVVIKRPNPSFHCILKGKYAFFIVFILISNDLKGFPAKQKRSYLMRLNLVRTVRSLCHGIGHVNDV